MPKKQPIAKASVTSAVPARVAKPGTPRVTAVKKHSKAQSVEPVVEQPAIEAAVQETVIGGAIVATLDKAATKTATPKTAAVKTVAAFETLNDPREAIAKLAYSYWEARGRQHGSADEDWARAEAEYYSRSAS